MQKPVKITYTDEKINPVDFREYSDFEFRWIETILTKIIKRNDILRLLKKFEIKFFEENWQENLPISEMGNVLISDIPKKDLLPAVKNMMDKKYPNKISFNKAKEIWEKLEKLNADEIKSKFFKASGDKNYKSMRYFIGGIEKTEKEVGEWKKAIKKEKIEGEKAVKMMKKFVNEQWSDKDEWYKMQDKLNQLSLEELRDITTKLGINFAIGNKNIKDKQDFILVLDEAVKSELLKEFHKIIKRKGGDKK